MFGALIMALLYCAGVVWCVQIIRRFPDDIREIRQVRDKARTTAIVLLWLVTVPILLALIPFTRVMIKNIIEIVKTFTGH